MYLASKTLINHAGRAVRIEPGVVIHGFANGVFGRDSYHCRTVEGIGSDWAVTRNTAGAAELVTDEDIRLIRDIDDRTYCGPECGT